MMRTKAITCIVAMLLGLCAIAPAVQAADKPNIIVIWGDDIGWSNISAYNHGMMGYKTPNIDRIAKEGALFTDFMLSRVAPRDEHRSFWASTPFEPAC
jgi:hypothetical protein